ncbi:type VI secretion system ATPase TssH [Pollutimonas harenae]|uniref:Type VI secretion system ATPase TssH n=1 Tax=Pollutimonas harenae TaxID=657015 RepID=A0A853H3M2_9BURK|nr:type VI secretion system ATPase TssH [Pollutimonas harenae]NYT86479.1 type VI secretion system ATPase TssH [Pollutimonas harenae]TEA69776.1 type VI secretion system ATPase TssH [Pollutimonas harenae]
MSDISRVELFGKLGDVMYRTLDGATTFCKLRHHSHVELVHWLHQLHHARNTDLHAIMAYFALDAAAVDAGLLKALDQLPQGTGSVSDLSGHIDEAVERAWIYASLKYSMTRIRSGHLMAGLLKTSNLRHVLFAISSEFKKVVPDLLLMKFDEIVQGSAEQDAAVQVPQQNAGDATQGALALAQYAVDLTARARAGQIDPVSGRNEEIRQIIDILMRRRQNNPLLTGEAGVGKTAVIEGLALRLAQGDVPPALRDVSLYMLDLGLLQAGVGVKGEFEARLRSIIDAIQSSEKPIVLFIDEIHTLVGAGGTVGTGDAANLLKPVLARGELRTIGATTWAEYKKYIEKDPALTRRFQAVQIAEPSEEQAVVMLRGLARTLAEHHKVLLLDQAIDAAVRLSYRYIPARQLPDKAVALLDTACARVAVSQHAVPADVEDCRREIEALGIELQMLDREQQLGIEHESRNEQVQAQLDTSQERLAELDGRWQAEHALVTQLHGLQSALHEAAPALDEQARLRKELDVLRRQLAEHQGETPLIFPAVDAAAVAAVVAEWTGIPVGRMLRDEAVSVLQLADTLEKRVVGQRHGLDAIARRIETSRAKLTDPNKPVGVFLLCGPSGVGKTETALALADTLYGGEQNVIAINMSEFQEPHTVSTLKGAPPGYVGYGEGGVLTEAVRRRPHSVILLDEVEKAHPDVHEIFFQVFDKGWMEDGEGRYIDFRNTVIILTSNVGSDRMAAMCRDTEQLPPPDELSQVLRQPLLQMFPAALLGRLIVVPYYPLPDNMLAQIVALQLERIQARLMDHHQVQMTVQPEVIDLIVERCTEVESGGRMIDSILSNTVLPRVSRELLAAAAATRDISAVSLTAEEGEFVYRFS